LLIRTAAPFFTFETRRWFKSASAQNIIISKTLYRVQVVQLKNALDMPLDSGYSSNAYSGSNNNDKIK
jgi:hypothetical protein